MKYSIHLIIFSVILVLELIVKCKCEETSIKTLRVSIGDLPVFTRVDKYDEYGLPAQMSGYGYEYLNWICLKLNLKPNITRFYKATNVSNVMSLMVMSPNGTMSGALGDLFNNVSDIVVTIASQRPEYIPYFELTFPIIETSFFMFGPYPKSQDRVWAILKPFSPWTWALVVLCLFFNPLVMTRLSKIKLQKVATRKQRKITYDFLLIYFLTVITGQGHRPRLERFRNAVSSALTWCLGTIVIANAYKGLLTTFLTLDTPVPIVSSYSELATQPELVFYTYNNSLVHYSFMTTTEGNFKLFGDILRKNPNRVQQTVSKCLEEAEAKQHICFSPAIPGNIFVAEKFQKSGTCTMARIGSSVMSHKPIFLVRKDYTYARQIHKGIMEARSFGLEQKWSSDQSDVPDHCEIKPHSKAKVGKMTMQNLRGPFLLLVAGIAASSVCFLMEFLVHFLHKKRSKARRLFLELKGRSQMINLRRFLRKRSSEGDITKKNTVIVRRLSC